MATGKNGENAFGRAVSWFMEKVKGPDANKPKWNDPNNPWRKAQNATRFYPNSSNATVSDATGNSSNATNKGTAIGDKGKQQPDPSVQGGVAGPKYKPRP